MKVQTFIFFFLFSCISSYKNLNKDCHLRLGDFRQGFLVRCRGGEEQNQKFIWHLRQKVLLPMVLKMALKTDLCLIATHLKHHTEGGNKGAERQARAENMISDESKSVLEQLTTGQLETLLQELQFSTALENGGNLTGNGTSGMFQWQSQEQNITAEIHTHKHIYVVISETGELVALPPFSDMLNNSSLTQIIDLVGQTQNSGSQDSGVPVNIDLQGPQAGGGSGDSTNSLGGNGLNDAVLPAGDGVFHCNSTSKGMTTNFVNPQYPLTSRLEDTGQVCSFMLEIADSSVCQVRVDFVDTELLPPDEGECNQQYLTVNGHIWPLGLQKFCGVNDGQHFYIEIDPVISGKSRVEFAVVTSSGGGPNGESLAETPFKWGLWITQIKCDGSSPLESPKGCFQYFSAASGQLTSFGYQPNGQYLNNQAYRVCIMTAKGACRISFKPQSFGLEKFGNYKTSPYHYAGVSSLFCVRDFLRIPDGSSTGFLHMATHDRYCGGHFNPMHNGESNEPVVAPLLNRLYTLDVRVGNPHLFPAKNSAGNEINPIFNPIHHMPGFKIEYEQITGDGCPVVDLSFVGK